MIRKRPTKPIGKQVILVTGATDGIGRGTATELARHGATVLLHGRNGEKLAAVRDAIAREVGDGRLETYVADFASLREVRRLADELTRRHDAIDALVNNAGVGSGRRNGGRELSADGYELRFQVNHLAPYLLESLLLPLLRRAAPARVVNVASSAQVPIDFGNPLLERGYNGYRAYSQSKLAMVMATVDLAGRLDPDEVTVNAVHPGTMLDTKMVREDFGRPYGPVATGVESELYLTAAPDLEGISGQYFDQTRPARAERQAYDEAARQRLRGLSRSLIEAAS